VAVDLASEAHLGAAANLASETGLCFPAADSASGFRGSPPPGPRPGAPLPTPTPRSDASAATAGTEALGRRQMARPADSNPAESPAPLPDEPSATPPPPPGTARRSRSPWLVRRHPLRRTDHRRWRDSGGGAAPSSRQAVASLRGTTPAGNDAGPTTRAQEVLPMVHLFFVLVLLGAVDEPTGAHIGSMVDPGG